MSTFDAALKRTQQAYTKDLVPLITKVMGLTTTPTFTQLDTALPAATFQADGLFRLETEPPKLLHIEYESSHQLGRPKRFLAYNALVTHRESCETETVVILLRPEAESSDMVSPYVEYTHGDKLKKLFDFNIIRVWEYPPEEFLSGGPGMWTLAPLGNVAAAELPQVMTELKNRWDGLAEETAKELSNLTKILMGLVYNRDTIRSLFRGISGMEDSVVYQDIIQLGIEKGEQIGIAKGKEQGEQIGIQKGELKGKIEMARVAVISSLEGKFGSVRTPLQEAINALTDLERLTRMLKEVHRVTSPEAILELK
jgi:predicted transposase YdaD